MDLCKLMSKLQRTKLFDLFTYLHKVSPHNIVDIKENMRLFTQRTWCLEISLEEECPDLSEERRVSPEDTHFYSGYFHCWNYKSVRNTPSICCVGKSWTLCAFAEYEIYPVQFIITDNFATMGDISGTVEGRTPALPYPVHGSSKANTYQWDSMSR